MYLIASNLSFYYVDAKYVYKTEQMLMILKVLAAEGIYM